MFKSLYSNLSVALEQNDLQQAFTSKTKSPSEPELQSTLIAPLLNSLGLTFLFLDLMKASIGLGKD